MNRWLQALGVYTDRRLIAVLLMGFSSGLPLALTGSTLSIWMTETGVSLATIGFFALVGTAYNFKWMWSPLIDNLPIPVLTRLLGRRRSWAIVTQIALMLALLALGSSDPKAAPAMTALLAVLVAFLSASQDIVIDAYRVELLEENQQGAGAAMVQYGYRIGMLAAGAGALFLAEIVPWFMVYAVMAALMVVGIVTVLMTREPTGRRAPPPSDFAKWAQGAFVDPFAEFARRRGWVVILVFIVLYKFGDALAGVMASPFYVKMGFSKAEIASISKLFGLVATLLGVFLGGLTVVRVGVLRGLLYCGVLQMLSNLMFAFQASVGYDINLLTVTIGIENLTGGMGSAAFVAYLSMLCHRDFTATHYALLSSLAAVGRTMLASYGGVLAEQLGWVSFFLATTVAALPGILLLLWLMRVLPMPSAAPAPAR